MRGAAAWRGGGRLAEGERAQLFGALQPALEQYAAPEHQKAIMSGFKQYDSTRSDVMEGYNQVEQHYNRIRRAVPEINL